MGAPCLVSQVSFKPVDDVINLCFKDYEIQASNDGIAFHPIATGTYDATGKTAVNHYWTEEVVKIPSPERTQYIRIVVKSTYDNRGYTWAAFGDIQIYGTT